MSFTTFCFLIFIQSLYSTSILEAKIKDIPLVKSAKLFPIVIKRNINFDRFGFISNPSIESFAVVKENYAFDKDKRVLFISVKVAKALNLKPGSLAQVN